MPALNVRDFPADLLQTLKAEAEAKGTTLREHCIAKLKAEHDAAADHTTRAIIDTRIEKVMDAIPEVTTASQLPTEGDHPGPAPGRCWKCGAGLIPWGPGQKRCRSCAMNFPAG